METSLAGFLKISKELTFLASRESMDGSSAHRLANRVAVTEKIESEVAVDENSKLSRNFIPRYLIFQYILNITNH